MAVVNTCPSCNRSMSSDLTWCPHCEQIYPRIVTCFICYQELNNTESIVKRKKTEVIAYYHPSCYGEVLKEQTCPTCNYTFSEQEQNKFGRKDQYLLQTNCPNCGQKAISFFYCVCQMRGFLGKDVGREYSNVSSGFHRACAKAQQIIARQKGESRAQLLLNRKKAGLCLVCGKKTSWFERLTNGGRCNWDASSDP